MKTEKIQPTYCSFVQAKQLDMKQFKIIPTEDYILAVSDEEIKESEELIPNKWYINSYRGYDKPFKNHNLDNNGYLKQVIAYQPKGNAPELDLPLLPEIVIDNDEVKKVATKTCYGWKFDYPKYFIAETIGGDEYLAGIVAGNEIWAEYPIELKTTTINNKIYLVGIYKFE
jgi:hypothetical protein